MLLSSNDSVELTGSPDEPLEEQRNAGWRAPCPSVH